MIANVTFGNALSGFKEWFEANIQTIADCFSQADPEVKEEFGTLEDFAVEVYCEIISPSPLDNLETINTI